MVAEQVAAKTPDKDLARGHPDHGQNRWERGALSSGLQTDPRNLPSGASRACKREETSSLRAH